MVKKLQYLSRALGLATPRKRAENPEKISVRKVQVHLSGRLFRFCPQLESWVSWPFRKVRDGCFKGRIELPCIYMIRA